LRTIASCAWLELLISMSNKNKTDLFIRGSFAC